MSFLPHLSWECVVSELRFGWRSLGYAPIWHSCWSGCILERPPNHSIQARVTSSPQLCGRASYGTNTSVLKAAEACWCRKTLREVCLMEAKLFIFYIYICSLRIWHIHNEMWSPHPRLPSPFLSPYTNTSLLLASCFLSFPYESSECRLWAHGCGFSGKHPRSAGNRPGAATTKNLPQAGVYSFSNLNTSSVLAKFCIF